MIPCYRDETAVQWFYCFVVVIWVMIFHGELLLIIAFSSNPILFSGQCCTILYPVLLLSGSVAKVIWAKKGNVPVSHPSFCVEQLKRDWSCPICFVTTIRFSYVWNSSELMLHSKFIATHLHRVSTLLNLEVLPIRGSTVWVSAREKRLSFRLKMFHSQFSIKVMPRCINNQ